MSVQSLEHVEQVDRERGQRSPRDRTLVIIASIACVLFVIISATAKVATYRFNIIFLAPLMWAPYLLRRRLDLHPVHFAMFAVAILLHDLGAYGLYRGSPLPFSYDILVHYYFAVPVTLMLNRALRWNLPQVRPWMVGVMALMFMMGFGALHEIMEYGSYLLLGEEKGMLKPSSSYVFDTQRDLMNNLLGTLTALLLLVVHAAARGKSPRA